MAIYLVDSVVHPSNNRGLVCLRLRRSTRFSTTSSPASKIKEIYSRLFSQVPFLPGAYGIDEFQEVVENKLFNDFKARPHWGKNNRLNEMKIRSLYHHEQLATWRDVYKMFNKGGPFDNLFTYKMGFDLFHHIEEQPTE